MTDQDITELYLNDLSLEFEGLDIDDIDFEHERFVSWGDEESRNKLVIRAAPLVVALVRRLSIPRDFRDDAIQAGNLAVIRAIDSWDKIRGFRFTTWAAWKAARDMLREVEKLDGRAVAIDLSTIEWLIMMEDNSESVDSFDTLQFAKNLSLQIPVGNTDNEELEASILSEQLRAAILKLSDRQQRVLCAILEGQNFTEVADSFGISKQAVSEAYRRIVQALRNFLHVDLVKS